MKKLFLFVIFAMSAMLAACGGGGAAPISSAIGGSAAAKAPIDYNLDVTSVVQGGYYGIYDAQKGTQTLTFTFTGHDYYSVDKGFKNLQHTFVVMQGKLGEPGNALQGIGVIIGNTSLRPDGCMGVTIENFSGGTNTLYPTACTNYTFVDGVTYSITAYATLSGEVGYSLFDQNGALIGTGKIQNMQNINDGPQRSVMIGSTVPASGTGGISIDILKYTNAP